jgi:hypothetical protein
VDYAVKLNNMEFLEAPFVIRCNDRFHKLQESVTKEVGYPDPEKIYFEWDNWIKREMKKFQLKEEGEGEI